jgi:hypothetical protein
MPFVPEALQPKSRHGTIPYPITPVKSEKIEKNLAFFLPKLCILRQDQDIMMYLQMSERVYNLGPEILRIY